MSEDKISEAQENQLLSAVRGAIAQTNGGVDPNDALAKEASAHNYGPDFVNRMVEMYNTSRTLAHLKQASGPGRATDFDLADASSVLEKMFSVNSRSDDISGGEMGKAANFMKVQQYEDSEPAFEKAAAYRPDGVAKFQKVLNNVRDIEQRISNLATKKAEAELARDDALSKAASYFRTQGHTSFEDVDAHVQSLYGGLGKMAMDVIWETVEGLRGEKRAEDLSIPRVMPRQMPAPYNHIADFLNHTTSMLKYAHRTDDAKQELDELKSALKGRVKQATSPFVPMGAAQMLSQVVGGTPLDPAAKDKAELVGLATASDPAHENRLRSIKAEADLQDLMAEDPVISQYDPSDVVDAFNELSRLSPSAGTQPIIMRGYLRRLLESSPDVAGRVLEGHEAAQLAEIDKNIRPQKEGLKDVLDSVRTLKGGI
jgi:hypothetical protein